jgi:ABC-2 type transport system permease protein
MLGIASDAGIIFEEEFRRQLKRTGWRIFTVLIPLLLLIAAVVVPIIADRFTGDGDEPDLLGYVDNSGITDSLGTIPGATRFADLGTGTSSLADESVKSLFVIPADYIETGNVDWYRTGSGLIASDDTGDAFHGLLRAAVADESLTPEQVLRVVAPAEYTLFTVDDEGRPESGGSRQDQIARAAPAFLFAMLLLISIFVGSAALMQSVAEEKENRMVEMLVTSTTPMSIMLGKVLALGATGLLQVSIWIVAAVIAVPRISDQFGGLSALSIEAELLVFLVAFYFAGYFVVAALMAAIGAATTSVREATQISALITIPSIVPIYSSALIISSPDGTYARIVTFFPLTSATASMMRLAGGNYEDL